VQVHVEIEDSFYEQGKQAIKALGWATVSEYVRAKIREAIREAERR
jgi:hypothetical protein